MVGKRSLLEEGTLLLQGFCHLVLSAEVKHGELFQLATLLI